MTRVSALRPSASLTRVSPLLLALPVSWCVFITCVGLCVPHRRQSAERVRVASILFCAHRPSRPALGVALAPAACALGLCEQEHAERCLVGLTVSTWSNSLGLFPGAASP